MDGYYEILMGDKPIGKAQVIKEGLYYRFICRCKLTGEVVYKIMVRCGGKQESLGICVPMGGGFGLETKLPAKRLGEGEPVFYAAPKHAQLKGKFVPIYPEEPFNYIAKLKDAYLARQEGQLGVIIQE